MKNYFIAILLLCIFAGCRQREEKDIRPVNMSDTIVTAKEVIKTVNEQSGDTIQMLITDDKGIYNGAGSIDSLQSRVYVKFANKVTGKLKASIIPQDGDGNIRFNQIILPDKTSDGPFGKDLEYQLKTTGDNILVIGHSLMAEGQYIGKFKVKLELPE